MSRTPKLYVYRIVTDNNTAPHISDDILTLTLCKPDVRSTAKVGDYVLALVALSTLKQSNKDRLAKAAYLFKVTEVVKMDDYKNWCDIHSKERVCTNNSFTGDCQYYKNTPSSKKITWHPGPHTADFEERNLGGTNSLVSTHFAAWTSFSPRILKAEDREALGLDDEKLQKSLRNYFTEPLTPSRQRKLEELIAEYTSAHKKPEGPCGGAGCKKKGGARRITLKKTRKHRAKTHKRQK